MHPTLLKGMVSTKRCLLGRVMMSVKRQNPTLRTC